MILVYYIMVFMGEGKVSIAREGHENHKNGPSARAPLEGGPLFFGPHYRARLGRWPKPSPYGEEKRVGTSKEDRPRTNGVAFFYSTSLNVSFEINECSMPRFPAFPTELHVSMM